MNELEKEIIISERAETKVEKSKDDLIKREKKNVFNRFYKLILCTKVT